MDHRGISGEESKKWFRLRRCEEERRGLGLQELRELRLLRHENAKLKQVVADLTLDRHILLVVRQDVRSPPFRKRNLVEGSVRDNVSGRLMERVRSRPWWVDERAINYNSWRRCDVTTRLQVLALGAVAILAVASPLFAHHTWPVDRSREIRVKGTVTGYSWANPHVMIDLDVRDDGGKIEKWNVGGPSVTRMAEKGWNRSTLKAGDAITAIGYRFLDGSNVLRLEKIITSDGKELFLYGSR